MGERVVVIGGSRGTGALTAPLLLSAGYRVRVMARDPGRARARLPEAVEVVAGDLTRPETLFPALSEATHVIHTAGLRGAFAGEGQVRAVTYDGLRGVLAASREAGLPGRFLYMTTVGLLTPSPLSLLLNLLKRNLLKWRREAEAAVRASGFDYTIVRAGLLTYGPPGGRVVVVSQGECALSLGTRISRRDVARALVAALPHPATPRTTFNLMGATHGERRDWDALFEALRPDDG